MDRNRHYSIQDELAFLDGIGLHQDSGYSYRSGRPRDRRALLEAYIRSASTRRWPEGVSRVRAVRYALELLEGLH